MEQSAATYLSKQSAHSGPAPVRARKEERFRLKQGFVACSSTNFCEIVNISNGGMALQYLAHRGSECEEINEINILNNLEGYLLGQLSCRIVYVKDMVPASQHDQTIIRRVGMQFMDLSSDQQERLDDLLIKFSLEKEQAHSN